MWQYLEEVERKSKRYISEGTWQWELITTLYRMGVPVSEAVARLKASEILQKTKG